MDRDLPNLCILMSTWSRVDPKEQQKKPNLGFPNNMALQSQKFCGQKMTPNKEKTKKLKKSADIGSYNYIEKCRNSFDSMSYIYLKR